MLAIHHQSIVQLSPKGGVAILRVSEGPLVVCLRTATVLISSNPIQHAHEDKVPGWQIVHRQGSGNENMALWTGMQPGYLHRGDTCSN